MARCSPRVFLSAAFVAAAFSVASLAHAAAPSRESALVPETADGQLPLLVRTTPGSADALAARVRALGGTVTYRFQNLDALSIRLPREAANALAAEAGVVSAQRQRWVHRTIVPVEVPRTIQRHATRRLEARDEFAFLDPAQGMPRAHGAAPDPRGSDPESFFGYDVITGAAEAWKIAGQGEGVVVAIIDTGVYPDHPMIPGNVVGGQNLVPAEEEQAIDANFDGSPEGLSFDWNAVENDGHGTFCAGLVAGHVDLEFPLDHPLVASLMIHSPESVEVGDESAIVRLRGAAPGASLYAIKIFPYDGGSAPDARVVEAIDRLVTMKRTGQLDVDVISMSLSGPVLFDGMNPLDAMVDVATSFGITCVSAAANEGPSLVSVGSPGSAHSSLTVGATQDPLHTRVAAEVAFGLPTGMGGLLYPHDDPKLIEFSSRGLTADKRVKPDILATGFVVFSSGLADFNQDGVNETPSFGFGSGTAFSTPTVAGAAALVTAYGDDLGGLGRAPFVANVLKKAAVPIAPKTSVSEREQGRGYVRIPDALELLASGAYLSAGDEDPAHGLMTRVSMRNGPASGTTPDLQPGETYNVLIDIPHSVSTLEFEFPMVTLAAPDDQNPIFGDAMGAQIHSAKRGGSGDYVFAVDAFDGGLQPGDAFAFEGPEPGTVRLTFSSSAFNYGPASASWSVDASREMADAFETIEGLLHHGEPIEHSVNVPDRLEALGIRLVWDHDWTTFPTVDLDMWVESPEGFFPIASIDSPEFGLIENPPEGTWTIHITDLETALGPEKYQLQIFHVLPKFHYEEMSDEILPRILGTSPNPSRGSTDIRFALPVGEAASVRVYDVAGRVVRSLASGPQEAGEHTLRWDGSNDSGESVGGGVYFVRVETKSGTTVRKMTILD